VVEGVKEMEREEKEMVKRVEKGKAKAHIIKTARLPQSQQTMLRSLRPVFLQVLLLWMEIRRSRREVPMQRKRLVARTEKVEKAVKETEVEVVAVVEKPSSPTGKVARAKVLVDLLRPVTC
jgi:hypothetical protein